MDLCQLENRQVLWLTFSAIDNTVTEAGIFHPPVLIKLFPSFGNRALVCATRHAHPSREHPQVIYGVKRLAPAIHLGDKARSTLRRTDGTRVERNKVDLVLHTPSGGTVHLRMERVGKRN